MRIERIDERTVKCFLSNEELEEYDISYKDFLMRSEKAREVVEVIIEQAEEEVGYQPPRFAFDLQIMMLPDKGMILTFSERDPNADSPEKEFLDCLRTMRDMFTHGGWAKALQGELGDDEMAGQLDADHLGDAQAMLRQTGGPDGGQAQPEGGSKPAFAIFRFHDFRSLRSFARALPEDLKVETSLYTLHDQYFLFLERGEAPYLEYSHACVQAMEFSFDFSADENQSLYLKEHGECLMAENALEKLRSI